MSKQGSTQQYLLRHGWRVIGQQRNGVGLTFYWDHPSHQPRRRGAFTTTAAVMHQRRSDEEGCDCIHEPAE